MPYPPNIINLLPSGSTASALPTAGDQTLGTALPYGCDQVLILVKTTDSEAVAHTGTFRMWGFNNYLDTWYSIGQLNAGVALAEVSANGIDYAELLVGVHGFDRLYCQIVSLGGAGHTVQVDGVCRRAELTSR